MLHFFGCRNLTKRPSDYISKIRPDFQPAIESISDDTALFLGKNIPEAKSDFMFEDSELIVTIVGNIYFKANFREKYLGFGEFQNMGIAATVATLYSKYGLEIASDLTGDFVIIIGEKLKKKLSLIRDKMGGRKIYYTILEGHIVFSSNIKSLLAVPGVSRDIDYFGLESFLKFGYIIAPTTVFKLFRVEPGHLIAVKKDGYDISRYWHLHPNAQITDNKNDIRKVLYEKIEENICDRLKLGERVGIYLSGGIDSNTLLAVMSNILDPSEIQTLSIGYGEQYKDYHELNQARFSANYFSSSHHELVNGPEHIDEYLCKMVWHYEQPFGNPALISCVALSERAKDLVDVVFQGTGADEILGGYKRYNALNFAQIYTKIPGYSFANKVMQNVLGNLRLGADHYSLAYRLQKFFNTMQPDILETNEALLFGDYKNLRERLFLPELLISNCTEGPTLNKCYEIAEGYDPFSQIFIADCYSNLVSEQLTRGLVPLDEHGIDYRVPFSDPDFMAYCLSIPKNFKFNFFETKIIYKEAVSSILPTEIIQEKKRGMSHPVNLWFQGPLYGALRSILSADNKALKNYFNIGYLRVALDEHYARKRDWGNLLWKMIVFSMWHKLFVENEFSSMPDYGLKDIASYSR